MRWSHRYYYYLRAPYLDKAVKLVEAQHIEYGTHVLARRVGGRSVLASTYMTSLQLLRRVNEVRKDRIR